jgi:4-amino-4-deoxy-L-arabinose transferase-like glycosyltransferase
VSELTAKRLYPLPSILYPLFFAAVALSHLTLLHLPYFWDEGGYYIPAALDFFRTGQLVPHFTNAHPPLPNILLGTLWHLTGFHVLATRLFVCAFAAAALLAVYRLTQHLLDTSAAITVTFLTAVYPIWFAQSTLAHADIFAAAFTLSGLALYLPATQNSIHSKLNTQQITSSFHSDPSLTPKSTRPQLLIAILFSLAALSKETSILQPATLAGLELFLLVRDRRDPTLRPAHLRLITALAFPVLPLVLWYIYHHHITGFTFGNPEFLRYNATANLTFGHIFTSLRYRFLHLFWQRNIWLPITLALACLFLPRRFALKGRGFSPAVKNSHKPGALAPEGAEAAGANALSGPTLCTIFLLVLANWLFFSVLGGALLTRYLLPIYPLILLVCVDTWRTRTRLTFVFTAITAGAFISALWLNPPTSFAPEDNLTYRDMVVVHQQAIDYVAQHYPNATVLTAWPVAADLFNPWLGYTATPIKGFSIEDFTRAQIARAAAEPGRYDTAIVFTTHYTDPAFRSWLLAHPDTRRGRDFAATRDLSPNEIAALLGGQVIITFDRHAEWAAVLRFPRSYSASLATSH